MMRLNLKYNRTITLTIYLNNYNMCDTFWMMGTLHDEIRCEKHLYTCSVLIHRPILQPITIHLEPPIHRDILRRNCLKYLITQMGARASVLLIGANNTIATS